MHCEHPLWGAPELIWRKSLWSSGSNTNPSKGILLDPRDLWCKRMQGLEEQVLGSVLWGLPFGKAPLAACNM